MKNPFHYNVAVGSLVGSNIKYQIQRKCVVVWCIYAIKKKKEIYTQHTYIQLYKYKKMKNVQEEIAIVRENVSVLYSNTIAHCEQ